MKSAVLPVSLSCSLFARKATLPTLLAVVTI
jgi:hypothetical protein